jgi:hypothetical protein
MTDQERLIQEIRERLSALKGAGSIDPMAVANELGGYSIAVGEICVLVTKEAEAAGISIIRMYPHPATKK